MTKTNVMQVLLREYPNGVSFAPMALRLLRQKVPLKDAQVEGLKGQMFQMGDGLWFTREMIGDDKSLVALHGQATTWLTTRGCFSVERLLERYSGVLRHVVTPENCAAFLRHMGFTVDAWRRLGYFCYESTHGLEERLAETSKKIAELLHAADGTIALTEIEQAMPHLTVEALEGVRAQFLPEVHKAEVGGVPCWRSAEAVPLPEDFAERVTAVVDTLVALGERVSVGNLEFALNLFYCMRFREEYALSENAAFMRVCAKHYQGRNTGFGNPNNPGVKTNGLGVAGGRVRSPNTRFRNLDIPIGAELVFSKDRNITCTVLDDTNQVKYGGKAWAISALAIHLLGVPVANGFCHFCYGGETLLERRVRMEQEGNCVGSPKDATPPAVLRDADRQIVGLEGQPLLPTTWRAFKSAGTSPRVAEWAQRVARGESVEKIAEESGYSVSTVKVQLGDRRRYFRVCEMNRIVPEEGLDV